MSPDQNPHTAPNNDEMTYQGERSAAWETAVEALTAAVRLTHPSGGVLDFAGFLTSALAAVAANVGSTDRLVAGRSGSWEAGLVHQLVAGTVGHDDEDLITHRTEPVVVPLDVRTLVIEDVVARTRSCETPYEAELAAVDAKYDALPTGEHDHEGELAELVALQERWAGRYAAYADAFTAAVQAEAAQITGLDVPVLVEANTELDETDAGQVHPDEIEDPDPLVLRLWQAAHRAVPLPDTGPSGTANAAGEGEQ